ncbi:MAG TPA: hypothetical protein VKE74_13680 [Gemmataceae bacterium]|nr:hypothetical protein [Gemmataceae bacterium]
MTRRLLTLALVAVAAVSFAGPAQAGLLPVRVSVAPEGDKYRWTYAIVLPSDSQLRPGDYFTIYDFGGYVSDSNSQPTDWSFSSSNLGTTPGRLNPDDSAELPNLTFTYTGPAIDAGQLGLGNFWALSDFKDATDSFFTARTHRTSDGRPDSNITETVVPVPTAPPPGLPEPTTLALAGLGLPLIGAGRLLRLRRS